MNIKKPIILGEFVGNGDNMGWLWYHEHHCRLAIVGDSKKTPKIGLLKGIANVIAKDDPKAVFWITDRDSVTLSEVFPTDKILYVEHTPDPPVEDEHRVHFIAHRKFFSSNYFNLLAKIHGIARRDLVPPASYRQHMEGPLAGYIRSIEQSEGFHKQWLLDQIGQLEVVNWKKTQEGNKFFLSKGGIHETALSFLIASWSIWSHIVAMKNPQQFLLILEVPEELLAYEDEEIRSVVNGILEIMTYMTHAVTMTCIVSMEKDVQIMHDLKYRYELFFDTGTKGSYQGSFMEDVHQMWNQGENDVGVWLDHALSQYFIIRFNKEHVTYMEEELD